MKETRKKKRLKQLDNSNAFIRFNEAIYHAVISTKRLIVQLDKLT